LTKRNQSELEIFWECSI